MRTRQFKLNPFIGFTASFQTPEASITLIPSNCLYADLACWDVCADDIDSNRKPGTND